MKSTTPAALLLIRATLLLPLGLATSTIQLSALGQSSAFTYQGRLNDGANPADGNYDLQFTIYDALTGGGVQGGLLTNAPTSVSNGLFTVTLDFGASPFTGADRWLEIGVRTNGSAGAFQTLTPRQQLAATPYATRAAKATSFTGSVSDGQLSANIARLNANLTFNGVVDFSNTSNNFYGSFSGDGGGLTNLNAATLTGTVGDAQLSTNVALRAGGNIFSGNQQVSDALIAGPGALDQQQSTFDHAGGGPDNWQSFTAGQSGALARIDLEVGTPLLSGSSSPGTIRIYAGEGTNGALLATQSVIFSNVFSTFQSFPLSVPPPVQSGSKYTIRFSVPVSQVTWVYQHDSNPYPSGRSDINPLFDYLFKTYVAPTATGTILTVSAPGFSGNVGVGTNLPQARLHVVGNVLASGTFMGDGSGLTGLNASAITSGAFSGNGSGLTSLNASQLTTGTVSDARLAGTYSSALTLNNAANNISGNGGGLTSLDASQLTTGTVSDARLAGTYGNALTLNNAANSIAGNGAGLTSLNASELSSGTVADVRLSSNVALLNGNQTFTGQNTFSNSVVGGGVSLDASSASGAFKLKNASGTRGWFGLAHDSGQFSADALDGDAVLRSAGKLLLQTAAGASAIAVNTNNFVGIGKINPATTLDVNGTVTATAVGVGTNSPATALHVASAGDAEISVQSTDPVGRRWTLQSSGGGTLGLFGTFQVIDRTAGASRLLIDTNGNVGIGTSGPTNKLHVNGGVSATAFVTTSDRNAKENFAPVDPREVLDKVAGLPISTWNFKTMNDGRHMGPVAQDFYAAFGLGGGDTTITTIDPDGVTLAAIQGLNEKVDVRSEKSEVRIQNLESENAELKDRLEKLERSLNEKNGGAR